MNQTRLEDIRQLVRWTLGKGGRISLFHDSEALKIVKRYI